MSERAIRKLAAVAALVVTAAAIWVFMIDAKITPRNDIHPATLGDIGVVILIWWQLSQITSKVLMIFEKGSGENRYSLKASVTALYLWIAVSAISAFVWFSNPSHPQEYPLLVNLAGNAIMSIPPIVDGYNVFSGRRNAKTAGV